MDDPSGRRIPETVNKLIDQLYVLGAVKARWGE